MINNCLLLQCANIAPFGNEGGAFIKGGENLKSSQGVWGGRKKEDEVIVEVREVAMDPEVDGVTVTIADQVTTTLLTAQIWRTIKNHRE